MLVLHMEREPHQVDGIAGQDHLLHRRVALRDLEGLLRTLIRRPYSAASARTSERPKAAAISPSAAADRADDLEMPARIFEEGRFGRGFDDGADIGQVDRLSMSLDLTQVLQLIDKTPEPKSIQVHTRNRSHR